MQRRGRLQQALPGSSVLRAGGALGLPIPHVLEAQLLWWWPLRLLRACWYVRCCIWGQCYCWRRRQRPERGRQLLPLRKQRRLAHRGVRRGRRRLARLHTSAAGLQAGAADHCFAAAAAQHVCSASCLPLPLEGR